MISAFVPDEAKVQSVSELTQAIKELLEDGFPSVWVAGEISNLARPSSGHMYLSLKDGAAQMRAVIWRGVGLRLRFDLHDGLEVIVRGRIGVYAPRGEYQLVIEELQPKGIGAQELALRQLKEKLFRLGYFAPERKKRLPTYPRRVGLVTSPTGAAVRDMLEILGRRWPATEVWVCPVKVQGDGAAEEIAAAIGLLNRLGQADVIIVGRGGGSSEDLAAFNAECVAHALFASRLPVVSAVGHEIDLTIADLVADHRALTPSEAAEIVTPNRVELAEAIAGLEAQMRTRLVRRLELARERLRDLIERRIFRRPLERVQELERRVDEWAERLGRAGQQHLGQARERVATLAARLETLSPLNVLSRGYSLTRRETDQVVVRTPDQVQPGDRLVTHVQHGRIFSRVEGEEVAVRSTPSETNTDGFPRTERA
jgi:exodeoxyribonuclease VII large subunit